MKQRERYLSIFRGPSHLARCYGDHVRMHTEAERTRGQSGLNNHLVLNRNHHKGNMSARYTEIYEASKSLKAFLNPEINDIFSCKNKKMGI